MSAAAQLVDEPEVLPPRTGLKGLKVPLAVLADDGKRPGLSTVVPAGAYRGIVPWTSPKVFLKGLREGLKVHPEMRRNTAVKHAAKDMMALDRFMRIMEAETLEADHHTGRDMRAREADTAKAAGCSVNDVKRAHRLASRVMGVMVPIVHGRLLTIFERLDVWGRQISPRLKQHGVTQVWAFHIPAWLRPFTDAAAIHPPPVDNQGRRRAAPGASATQPRSGDVPELDHLTYTSPSHPKRSKGGSLRSPSGPGSARTAPRKERRASPARRLAEKLVKAMPVLHSTHPQRLTPLLIPFVESRPAWDEHDLLDAFQDLGEVSGLGVPSTADGIETPWAFVKSLIDRLHPHDHPRLAAVDPAELRCGRTECDHGWIPVGDAVRRCDRCRPGAWPEPSFEELYGESADGDEEVPF